MQLPDWLIKATGAAQFANNPNNGFQPTIGDALQGIGHSMMENYRRDLAPSGSQAPGVPGGAPPAGVPAPAHDTNTLQRKHSGQTMNEALGLGGGIGMGLLGDMMGPLGLLGGALGGQGGKNLPLGLISKLF